MSRIGKQPIQIPKTVLATLDGNMLRMKGPRGEVSRLFKRDIKISINDGEIRLEPIRHTLFSKALWGTYASHIKNMALGTAQGFEKKLIIEGVGFRAEVSQKKLVLQVGFSHPVEVKIPEGITLTAEKNVLTIQGADKELVGQFAAYIRSIKKPEPYKGKGIKYKDEIIRRKQGKKAS